MASEQFLGQKHVVWGTDINMETCKANFWDVIDLAKDENIAINTAEPLYIHLLGKQLLLGSHF